MCSFQARNLWHHGSRSWNQALTRPVAHVHAAAGDVHGTAASGLSVYDTAGAKSWDFGADGGCYTLSDFRMLWFFQNRGSSFSQISWATKKIKLQEPPWLKTSTKSIQPRSTLLVSLSSKRQTFRLPQPHLSHNLQHAFGRFAWAVRTHPEVRRAFALLHDCEPDNLACSWDNPFYTPRADDSCSINNACTQLHWDMNKYFGGEIAPLADELCVQGVYYASPTSESTPAFVACPGSISTYSEFCEADLNPSKQGAKILNYMPVETFGQSFAKQVGYRCQDEFMFRRARCCCGHPDCAMETALHPGLRAATSVAALECWAELRLPWYATGGYGVNKFTLRVLC